MLTIFLCVLLFAVSFIGGYRFCAYVNGKLFQAMIDQGVILLRAGEEWLGESAAFLHLAAWLKKEKV